MKILEKTLSWEIRDHGHSLVSTMSRWAATSARDWGRYFSTQGVALPSDDAFTMLLHLSLSFVLPFMVSSPSSSMSIRETTSVMLAMWWLSYPMLSKSWLWSRVSHSDFHFHCLVWWRELFLGWKGDCYDLAIAVVRRFFHPIFILPPYSLPGLF